MNGISGIVEPRSAWTFLSNHSHVLIALAGEPDLRVRDLAERVGITERAVSQILADLQGAKVLTKRRVGRRNVYLVDANAPLRHAVEAHRTVADLLRLAERPQGSASAKYEPNGDKRRQGLG